MNRLAVALAADSAVTLGRGDASKIFQNENKIFELSSTKPIGVMFYNATQFYGVPWEIIIKDFRAERGSAACAKVFDWIPLFCEWLMASRFRPSDAAQRKAVQQALRSEFRTVHKAFSESLIELVNNNESKDDVRVGIQVRLQRALDAAIEELKAWDFDADMSLEEAMSCLGHYQAEFDAAVHERFGTLATEVEAREKIATLAAYVLKTSRPGPHTTGLVFAGFGDDELFPSLECIELNGVVADRLKRLRMEKVDIDRADTTGAVIPFAQRDTADSLLYGRSDEYDRQVGQHFRDVIEQVGKAVVEEATNDEAIRKRLEEGVLRAAGKAVDRFTTEYSREIARGFFKALIYECDLTTRPAMYATHGFRCRHVQNALVLRARSKHDGALVRKGASWSGRTGSTITCGRPASRGASSSARMAGSSALGSWATTTG